MARRMRLELAEWETLRAEATYTTAFVQCCRTTGTGTGLQGDTSGCLKPPVDIDLKVLF